MPTYGIFDFDQTLTIQHTFSWYSLDCFNGLFADKYAAGEDNSKLNAKKGIDVVFKHDLEHISAIATYHNNPLFIAGFVAGLLKKKLTYIKTYTSSTEGTAIDRYSVEGSRVPFLISYITDIEPLFSKIVQRLQIHGKNDQINSLRRIFVNEGLMDENTIIHFYDDTNENVEHAACLTRTTRHLIKRGTDTFTIVKSFLSPPPSKRLVAVPSAETPISHLSSESTKRPLVKEPDALFTVHPPFRLGPVPKLARGPLAAIRDSESKVTVDEQHQLKHDVDKESLSAAITKLGELELACHTQSIKRHVMAFIKHVKRLMDHKNKALLYDAVDKTYLLLHEPTSSLNDYRTTAEHLREHPNQKWRMLGTIMLLLGSAIALLLVAAAMASCPIVVLAPTAIICTAAHGVGVYGLFAGREKGLHVDMNNIAEQEDLRRQRALG